MPHSSWGSPCSGSIVDLTVAGVSFPGGVRREVEPVLRWVAEQFHARVERLHSGWNWGYSCRRIRGSSSWSNHAFGIALDFNAPNHPMGTSASGFSETQRATIREICRRANCRWGGDYSGRKDWMHIEFMGSVSDAQNLAKSLGGLAKPKWGDYKKGWHLGRRTLRLYDRGTDVRELQDVMGVKVDGSFGKDTEDAVKAFQRKHGLGVDGVVGPRTLEALIMSLADDVARRVWHWGIKEDDPNTKKDPKWMAQNYLKNIEADVDDLKQKVDRLTDLVKEIKK